VARHQSSPDVVAEDVEDHLKFVRKRSFEVSEPNENGLDRLLELSEKHGFPLYLVNGPAEESLAADPAFLEYYADVQDWLRGRTAGRSDVRLVFPEPQGFPAALMENADHLTAEGAAIYTQRLVEAVRISPGGGATP
jgi:hypothetical protein